jgi:protein subunit release factor A
MRDGWGGVMSTLYASDIVTMLNYLNDATKWLAAVHAAAPDQVTRIEWISQDIERVRDRLISVTASDVAVAAS